LFAGERLIVHASTKAEMLCKLHEGRYGMEICQVRTREVMYWSNMSKDIEKIVAKCDTCATFRKQNQSVHGQNLVQIYSRSRNMII